MIAALLDPNSAGKDGAGFARLLEYRHGRASRWTGVDGHVLAQITPGAPSPGHGGRGDWAPGHAPSGRLTLFNGEFHNRVAIATELGVPEMAAQPLGSFSNSDSALYALALDRWGDAADERIIGHYCTIDLAPDRASLRVSRSPLVAPPLHFRAEAGRGAGSGRPRVIAASIPRALFWQSDTQRQVNLDRLARSTPIDFTDRFAGWYQGCGRVPLGCALMLTPSGFTEIWRYDLFSRPQLRLARDQDYVETANALLDEGVAAALAGARRPGVLLSGGLDSSQVALSALRRLPAGQTLPSFTYGPEAQWTGSAPAGRYASEFPAVARLAAAYPQIRPEFFTHDRQDFRQGMRDLLSAMDCGPPGLGIAWAQHDLYERARERGCDILLSGDWGNLTFSNSAPWAPVEFFRRGRWLRLWQVLRHEPGDRRSLGRRFLARVVIPQLSGPLWRRAYGLRHGSAPDGLQRSGLSLEWATRHQLIERARAGGLDLDRMQFTSKRQFWQRLMTEDGQDHEQIVQGMQQLHGIPLRDPTAYRPLVEFCYGVPTEQFTRGAMNRFLARRMAAGRLPDELRLNRDLGQHHGDWALRIGRARSELIAELDRMAGDEDIAAMFDLPGLRRSLEDFPGVGTASDGGMVYQSALSLAIAGGRFIAYAKGRNDI